jgi:adenine-specific DNA-methyltransferase
MATGISGKEQLSEDSLTAIFPYKDKIPLPCVDRIELSYSNKASISEVLEPVQTSFVVIDKEVVVEHGVVDCADSLILTDNLLGLHHLIASGKKAALIYLDPPYNTGLDFHSRDLKHAYNDRCSDTVYIEFMRRRLILMRELLSDSGSIYVHIGHQMVAHLKIVMDEVFGAKNFRNLITRKKCSSKNFTKHQYANLNDFILFYSKTDNYTWNKPGEMADDEWIAKEYPKVDVKGQYKLVPVHAPGTRHGETGLPWRGILPPPGKHWQYSPSKLDLMDENGDIHWSKNGNPRRKLYLTKNKERPYSDYWDGFRDAHHQSVAISGYPTEKNLNMLKMIVSASSNPGDLVVDPFCGSGTTLHAARDLGREWVGMDQSFSAIEATLKRMRHGLSPMGDFVNKRKEKIENIDGSSLFDFLDPICVGNKQSNGKIENKFSLLVSSEIRECYESQTNALSMI